MISLGTDAPRSPRASILGGTGPYSTARGQIGLSFPFADVTDFDRELIVD